MQTKVILVWVAGEFWASKCELVVLVQHGLVAAAVEEIIVLVMVMLVVVAVVGNFLAWYVAAAYNNMTLVSNAQTAQTAGAEGRLTIFEEASTGSNVH